MAFLGQTYNQAELPQNENKEFEPLAAGWYSATISEANLKPTKAGTGEYIILRFDITSPEAAGRVVFTNLNIRNPNPVAQEIGFKQMGEVMAAIGLASVQDTDQFVGGNLQIKLSIKDDPQYGKQNEVKAYKALEASAPAAPTTPQATAATSAPPWASK